MLGTNGYITPSIWSKLFKSQLIKKSYVQVSTKNQVGEDFISLCICVLESNKVALMDGAYYHYRIRNESLSHMGGGDEAKETIKMYNAIYEVLDSYGCYQELKGCMNSSFWWRYVDRHGQCFQVEKYFFQNVGVLKGKKVVVYGAGRVGRDYYTQMCRYTECDVVAWMDSHPEQYDYPHIRLHGINDLESIEFDLLVIAVKAARVAAEICDQLLAKGIEKNKIYWSEPERFL